MELQVPHDNNSLAPAINSHEGLPVEAAEYGRIHAIDLHHIGEWKSLLRRQFAVVAAVFAAVVLTTAVTVLTATPQFTATTTLMIEPRTPNVLPVLGAYPVAPDAEENDYYKTQYDLLRTYALCSEVVKELHLDTNPLFTGEARPTQGDSQSPWYAKLFGGPRVSKPAAGVDIAVDRYLRSLSVAPIRETRLVEVSFTSPDPVLAEKVARTHVTDFVARAFRIRETSDNEAAAFLDR